MSDVGASGEDVDLWLDTELFMDVQLPSGEWVEGESVEVRGRWIRVRFFARADLAEQWINVDTDTARLAELHTRSGAEAQRKEAEALATRLELNEAAAAAAAAGASSSVAAAAGVAVAPAAAAAVPVLSARQQFESQVARDSYCEVLQRNRSQLLRMVEQDGEMWLQRLADQRFHAQTAEALGAMPTDDLPRAPPAAMPAAAAAPAALGGAKSMSYTPSSSAAAAAAASTSASSAAVSPLDPADVSLSVSAVSVKHPLFDSLTRHRLVVPVRSSSCAHPESFDLWTHVQHRIEQSDANPLWLCPICKREAFADDLHVDPLLFHVLRCVEDGRLDQHCKEAAREADNGNGASRSRLAAASTLTTQSPLMSAAALRQSLAAFDSLLEQPPQYGTPSSCSFEERRLTIALSADGGGGGSSLRLTVATPSDESARLEARRHMQRRARTLPTPVSSRSGDKRKSASFEDEYQPGSNASEGASAEDHGTATGPSPLKRQRVREEEGDEDEDADMANGPPASSAAAAAASAAASSSSAAAAATSAASACPWPSWVDADGLVWVDVRESPHDCEPPERWANIRVKMEKQHQAYQAIIKQQEALMAAPPPSPPQSPPGPQLAQAHAGSLMQVQGIGANGSGGGGGFNVPAAAAAAAASPFRPPPPLPRAATLPAASAAPSVSSPARSHRSKKLKRADSAAGGSARAPSSSSASASSSSAAAAASGSFSSSSLPLLDLNRCSVWELQQLDGVGPKLAGRIVTAREHKWLMKKVRFNDNIIDKRKERQQQQQQAAAGATTSAAAAASSSSPAAAATAAPAPKLESLCECVTPESCSHVRAFKSVKSLSKVEGLGAKMLQKLQTLVTV